MKIDIDKLTEAELVDLNDRIIQRLRVLQQMRAHTTMLEYSLGERVCFQPDGRPHIFCVVTWYNKQTVTVITDGGDIGSVSLSALHKASDVATPPESGNVVPFHKK